MPPRAADSTDETPRKPKSCSLNEEPAACLEITHICQCHYCFMLSSSTAMLPHPWQRKLKTGRSEDLSRKGYTNCLKLPPTLQSLNFLANISD